MSDPIHNEVASYYNARIAAHGDTPRGVDWNSQEGQELRFEQLTKIITDAGRFSVNDLGCGYGALIEYMTRMFQDFSYNGFDIAENMLHAARRRYANRPSTTFTLAGKPDQIADYGIASGIFNVRQHRSDAEWQDYINATLDALDGTSRSGFAFNCLTRYSDKDKMRDDLYYADPCFMFDLCKKKYSRNVALLHDYDLYEFTILVRK